MTYSHELAQRYIQMHEEEYHANPVVLDTLRECLPSGSTLLELGSATGADYAALWETYQVTGSDYSPAFLEYLRAKYQKEFLEIDARNFKLAEPVDAIYSNKVLHHLSPQELEQSFACQAQNLRSKGLMCHSFWFGEGEEHHGDFTVYSYNLESLSALHGPSWQLVKALKYEEFEAEDSLLAVWQRL